MSFRIIISFAALAVALVTAPITRAEVEDHARIRALAEAHALMSAEAFAPEGAALKAEAARLDARLRLAACPVEPQTFAAPGSRPSPLASVGVRCPIAGGWSLYVPVELEAIVDVVVLAAPTVTGETLTAAALRLEPANVARLNTGYLTRIADVEGWVLRRPVRPGTVLTPSLLERPTLVKRGQRVAVLAGSAGLAVRSEGEALSDAAEGDRVRVRNRHSRMIIEGVVSADGTVRIGG